MDDRRICKYPACNTILSKSNTGDYCSIHEGKQYDRDAEPKPMRKDAIPAKEKMYTVQDIIKILKYSDRTVRNMLKRGEIAGLRIGTRGKWLVPRTELDRFKKEGPGKEQSSRGLLSVDEIKEHDIGIFQKVDSIMSEAQVRELLWQLKHEQRYSASDFSMIIHFLYFLDLRGNNYIDEKLRNARDKLQGVRPEGIVVYSRVE